VVPSIGKYIALFPSKRELTSAFVGLLTSKSVIFPLLTTELNSINNSSTHELLCNEKKTLYRDTSYNNVMLENTDKKSEYARALLIDFDHAMFLTENYVASFCHRIVCHDSIVTPMFSALSIGYRTLYGSRTPVQS
jgi:hypothetical protein